LYDEARRLGELPLQAELGYWMAKAGAPIEPIATDHP
jgi:hypothetical protein